MFDITEYFNRLENNIDITIDNNIANYLAVYSNIYPALSVYGGLNQTTRNNLINQSRLSVRWLNEHVITRPIEPFKSVNVRKLSTVYYDNVPVVIIRNNNNNEDPFEKILFINEIQYKYSSAYLFKFVESDPGPDLEPYDKIGSFSGDVQPYIRNVNLPFYDLSNSIDVNKLNFILDYSLMYDY